MTVAADNPVVGSPTSLSTPIPTAAAGRLVVPPSDAGPWVLTQIERGMAIRKTRIRSTDDLDKARARKTEWVKQTFDLLAGMFDNDAVAQDFNTWDARVLPDYVDLKEFAEIFYDEMNQRLTKLKSIHRRIPPAVMPGAAAAPAPSPVAQTRTSVTTTTIETSTQEMPVNVPLPSSVAPAADPSPLPAVAGQTRCLLIVADADAGAATGQVATLLSKLGFQAHQVEGHGPSMRSHSPGAFAVFLSKSPPNAQMAYHLGYCAAKCGTERLLVLSPEPAAWAGCDLPVSVIQLDHSELWQFQLARQLRRSGVDLDMNRLC